MIQNAKHILYLLLLLLIFIAPVHIFELHNQDLEASNDEDPKTMGQILEKRKNYADKVQSRSANKLVNILVVPGHDDESYGTRFKTLKEVELNRILAQKLFHYLSKEQGINPVLASDENGYNPIFETYFLSEKENIEEFIESSKESFSEKILSEHLENVENDFHNVAASEVAYRLYGINRWVNTQDFDLVIHIHFNDHRGRKKTQVGKYDGFAIYTPGPLFENHELSRILADSIYSELLKIRPVSNLESEEEGIIEDHELIALGANESLEAGSILIEYGYIYEPIFTDPLRRDTSLDYLAYATYAGVMRSMNEVPISKEYSLQNTSKNKITNNNLMWQFQKALDGLYPPDEKTLRDCPITGYFGKCSQLVK